MASSIQENEKRRSTTVSSNPESFGDDTLGDNLRPLSPIPTFTQADFDEFDEYLEEVDYWDDLLPSLPSGWVPDTVSQAPTEVSQSMGSERSITSNVSPTTDNLPNKTPRHNFRPLTPTPTILQADFNLFDLLIEGWYGSRPQIPTTPLERWWGDLRHNRA